MPDSFGSFGNKFFILLLDLHIQSVNVHMVQQLFASLGFQDQTTIGTFSVTSLGTISTHSHWEQRKRFNLSVFQEFVIPIDSGLAGFVLCTYNGYNLLLCWHKRVDALALFQLLFHLNEQLYAIYYVLNLLNL